MIFFHTKQHCNGDKIRNVRKKENNIWSKISKKFVYQKPSLIDPFIQESKTVKFYFKFCLHQIKSVTLFHKILISKSLWHGTPQHPPSDFNLRKNQILQEVVRHANLCNQDSNVDQYRQEFLDKFCFQHSGRPHSFAPFWNQRLWKFSSSS